MMDTVLNLGLNDETVEALAQARRRRALRLRQLSPLHHDVFRRRARRRAPPLRGGARRLQGAQGLHARHRPRRPTTGRARSARYKAIVEKRARQAVPAGSEGAALGRDRRRVRLLDERRAPSTTASSTTSRRAGAPPSTCRRWCSATWATTSATGVAFTRNPSTGEKRALRRVPDQRAGRGRRRRHPHAAGHHRDGAQGRRLRQAARWKRRCRRPTPSSSRIYGMLEKHYRDMQDIEFTVEHGKLWMLQTRNGKRTAQGRAADRRRHGERGADHARTRRCSRVEPGVARPAPASDASIRRPSARSSPPACRPRPAPRRARSSSPPTTPRRAKKAGRKVILVRVETSPEDIHGMHAAEGILTTRGGMTSHAAVVARGMGKPCVSGAGSIRVDYAAQTMTVGGDDAQEGRRHHHRRLDRPGAARARSPMLEPELSGEFATLMGWADEVRTHEGARQRRHAARRARRRASFGAEGIGLCRTEHMFFEGDRIVAVREMILADDEAGRRAALAKLLPMQRARLRRALPHHERPAGDDPPARSAAARVPAAHRRRRSPRSRARIGVSRRQAEAPRRRAARVQPDARLPRLPPRHRLSRDRRDAGARHLRGGGRGRRARPASRSMPEIMMPLVDDASRARPRQGAHRRHGRGGARRRPARRVDLSGRHDDRAAARRACAPARSPRRAEFFSFGTNDLTQTTLGISPRRRRVASSAPTPPKGILPADPFVTIDQEGVGELVEHRASSAAAGRAPDIKLGICGEHGGDPASIALLRERRPRLRVLLALPRADRAARRGAGGARRQGGEPGVSSE